MATLNSALQIMAGALSADQSALDVTSNNVANANTPGYTRETAVFQANDSVTINGISYGQGVQMVASQSQRSLVLEAGLQQQTQAQQATNSHWTSLQQVENIFNQVTTSTSSGTGVGSLGDQVQNFFNSLSALSATPSSVPLREGVLSAAGKMTSAFNSAASQLNQQTASLNSQVQGVVQQINPLLTSIAQLNQQISSSSGVPNGQLEDQRQYDLQQLSQYVGVNVVQTEDNSIAVTTTGGALLVAKDQAFQLTASNVGGNTHVFTSAPGSAADITTAQASGGGQLAGLLQTRDQDIPAIQNQIDTLANSVATQLNTVQTAGTDLNGNPGTPLFNIPATVAGSAAGIAVALTDPSQIAASATGNGPGDNSNLENMINAGNSNITGGQTPSTFYSSFISGLGGEVSGLNTQNQAQQASLSQVQSQRNALSTASLNEEAANLQTYEQAYQAAAQVFSIVGTLINSALNLGVPTAVA
ncbi:MAG TPA: flagellar hook-associated protein FlgK [Acidobacteriaceae bacterium]|nr:flagellar hook-associated protein FlgK [Acidobacteriaceae bacterium]